MFLEPWAIFLTPRHFFQESLPIFWTPVHFPGVMGYFLIPRQKNTSGVMGYFLDLGIFSGVMGYFLWIPRQFLQESWAFS